MSLEKASISWSAKQLASMIKNERISFKHIVQRSFVWEKSRKSGLIESAILGYPIPSVFAKRVDDGSGKKGNVYYIMDGKQRLNTVKEFINDEFALTELSPVTYIDDDLDREVTVDISGMKFSELPDSLQNLIQTTMFSVVYFDNLTKEEERELFKRLNAGKPLSVKSKALASCQGIEELLDIGSHEMFYEMLTDKSLDNKNQVILVMKSWCMINQNISDISFESKIFNPLLERTNISEEDKINLIKVFDYIHEVHKYLLETKQPKEKLVAKKLYRETHFISLIPFVKQAMEDSISHEKFTLWITNFFGTKDTSISIEYSEASNNGAAKNANIVARNNSLKESFEEFFNEEEGEEGEKDKEEEKDKEDKDGEE